MRVSFLVALGFAALTTALGFKLQQVSRLADERIRSLSSELRATQEMARAITRQVQAISPPPFSLNGMDARTGEHAAFEPVESLVLYSFRSDCPYSRQNIPFLNGLSEQGLQVTGISPEEVRPAIAAFGRDNSVSFRLLAEPSGDVLRILPRGLVPVTTVFINGRLEAFWPGELSDEQKAEILTALGL